MIICKLQQTDDKNLTIIHSKLSQIATVNFSFNYVPLKIRTVSLPCHFGNWNGWVSFTLSRHVKRPLYHAVWIKHLDWPLPPFLNQCTIPEAASAVVQQLRLVKESCHYLLFHLPVNPAHPFRTFISRRLVAGAKRAADVDSSSPASHGPIRPIRDSLVTQSISLDISSSQKNCARVFIFPDAVIHAPQLPWSSCCSRNHRGAYVGFVKETQNHLDWHGM